MDVQKSLNDVCWRHNIVALAVVYGCEDQTLLGSLLLILGEYVVQMCCDFCFLGGRLTLALLGGKNFVIFNMLAPMLLQSGGVWDTFPNALRALHLAIVLRNEIRPYCRERLGHD